MSIFQIYVDIFPPGPLGLYSSPAPAKNHLVDK